MLTTLKKTAIRILTQHGVNFQFKLFLGNVATAETTDQAVHVRYTWSEITLLAPKCYLSMINRYMYIYADLGESLLFAHQG